MHQGRLIVALVVFCLSAVVAFGLYKLIESKKNNSKKKNGHKPSPPPPPTPPPPDNGGKGGNGGNGGGNGGGISKCNCPAHMSCMSRCAMCPLVENRKDPWCKANCPYTCVMC